MVSWLYIYIYVIYIVIYIYKIIFPMFSRSQSSKVPKFILFFALCWVLHTSWDRPRSSPDESSEGPGRSKWLQRLCDLIFKYILEPLGCRTRVLMNESGEAKKHSLYNIIIVWTWWSWCRVGFFGGWKLECSNFQVGYVGGHVPSPKVTTRSYSPPSTPTTRAYQPCPISSGYLT